MTPSPYLQSDGTALLQAAQWCEAVARGPAMTIVATLAIAGIGMGMLGGRVSARRGLSAVIGCFVVFGAPTISLGLMSAASTMTDTAYPEPLPAVIVPGPQPDPPQRPQPPLNNDPYAGAAVPDPRIRVDDLY